MTKLSYEEWEKWCIDTKWNATKEEIESWKTQYYSGLNTYDEFKMILREEYERYCKENETHTNDIWGMEDLGSTST